ncbi:MAG: prepilin-type N-terminal cleavage/methylation domain-containing protein [Patescibacteria group bacterium]
MAKRPARPKNKPASGKSPFRGFTLMEILIVIAILTILTSFIFGRVGGAMEKARMSRARAELSEIAKATVQMAIDHQGTWPNDVDRDVPPGIQEYLGPGNWPYAPWPGSVYDWDSFTGSDGKPAYQISIRFCPLGHPELCSFPDEPWAEDFNYFSSVYYCIQGKCRAHPSQPDSHPGYCLNCPSS